MAYIFFNNVSKRYRFFSDPAKKFCSFFYPMKPDKEIVALSDLSYQCSMGEVIAFVGKNGCGKSTVLKLIAGVIQPTSGELRVEGKIASILGIMYGLNFELTGVANIATKLKTFGFSKKEIISLSEKIINFSEVGDFITRPMKYYSAGMKLRVAFAITVFLEFDILLIDEALSVGDLIFQKKCLMMIRKLREEKKIIVISSHDLEGVSTVCDKVVLLKNGVMIKHGETEEVVRYFYTIIDQESLQYKGDFQKDDILLQQYTETKEVDIKSVEFLDIHGNSCDLYQTGDRIKIKICYKKNSPIKNMLFRIELHTSDGTWLYGHNNFRQNLDVDEEKEEGIIFFYLENLILLGSNYFFTIGIWPDEFKSLAAKTPYVLHQKRYLIKMVSGRSLGAGIVDLKGRWSLE